MPTPRDIRSVTRQELEALLKSWHQPAFRADQILRWLHLHRCHAWSEMTNLPKHLQDQLAQNFTLHPFALVRLQGAADRTRKFLWQLADGALIESVLLPASPALYGETSDRHTLCLSTQVGCAYGCAFCASGLLGWKRHLEAAEIVEQVLATERWHIQTQAAGSDREQAAPPAASQAPAQSFSSRPPDSRLINNLVIMGMGEPLANYENLLQALRILNAPWGGRIGARKITVSTSGLAPQIRRLAEEPFQFRLAVSLHAATDAVRDKIMPVNRKYPLRELTAACLHYQEQKGRMITLEYILIDGVNTDLDQVKPLAQLARLLHAKVNLIPYNSVEDLPWRRPDDAVCEAFCAALERHQTAVTLRREKGHDIDAACGQLRLKTEQAGRQGNIEF